MKEKSTNKREWVKTAIIVFLSIMLVLTFFSNTIMNYSLPEVATQYVESGSITAKIRGTGTLESGDPYNVEATESRKILSIPVRVGETVQKGDVLMYLSEEELPELKEKQNELATAKSSLKSAQEAYDLKTLDQNVTAGDISAANQGTSATAYRNKITNLQNEIKKLQAEVTPIEDSLKQVKQSISDYNTQIDYDKGLVTTYAEKITNLENQLGANKVAAYKEDWEEAGDKKIQYLGISQQAEKDLEAAQKSQDEKKLAYDQAKSALNKAKSDYGEDSNEYKAAEETYNKANIAYEESKTAYTNALDKKNAAENAYTAAVFEEADAKDKYETAQAEYDALIASDKGKALQKELDETNTLLAQANNRINTFPATVNALSLQQYGLEKDLTAANNKVSEKQEELAKLLGTIATVSGLEEAKEIVSNYQKEVDRIQAELDALLEKSVAGTITAPISGTVSGISYTAGQTFQYKDVLAVIQPEGQGYTLSFSVTNEQAKRLSVGDRADVVNSWRYEDVNIILKSIKTDKSNPGQYKLLTFDVSGDVVAGQTLNVSVGQKSANYDMIVPNSAIKEDSNGKFVLIIESKAGPLGNRYIATRVDVQVLASDDTRSAISGALDSWGAYVITTSNKPVEAGKQVRFND